MEELGSIANDEKLEHNSLPKKFLRAIHKLIERKWKRKTMFEEYFTSNKSGMDPERIKKFEKYKREMFEEDGGPKKY